LRPSQEDLPRSVDDNVPFLGARNIIIGRVKHELLIWT
jgi:hypothetical protein